MVKIGISFELLQNFENNYLFEILKCLKDEALNWHIISYQTEVWADKNGSELFLKEMYTSEEFFNLIQNNHYAVFLKTQAYSSDYNFCELHTKEEFNYSDCKIIVLICDSCWCDIYIKDKIWIENIYQTLIKNNITNVAYIYDNSDAREKFDVL